MITYADVCAALCILLVVLNIADAKDKANCKEPKIPFRVILAIVGMCAYFLIMSLLGIQWR